LHQQFLCIKAALPAVFYTSAGRSLLTTVALLHYHEINHGGERVLNEIVLSVSHKLFVNVLDAKEILDAKYARCERDSFKHFPFLTGRRWCSCSMFQFVLVDKTSCFFIVQ